MEVFPTELTSCGVLAERQSCGMSFTYYTKESRMEGVLPGS